MLIIADENMPYVREWFAPYGDVRTLPGRSLTAATVRDADILLVRSVTKVDRHLLQDSRVRFIGSATSGIEHVDIEYLEAHGVAFASAPGCNATAVAEYVISCLCALDGVLENLLAGGSVGIIGLGNVGARLSKRLQVLGIRCIGYDPFINANRELPLCDLNTVLDADVICCHTPSTSVGAHPTWHLFDEKKLLHLREGAVLINASRGAVVDNAALLRVLRQRADLRVVLDVWEREPDIDLELLQAVTLATPHIAGYSWDGKVAGTRQILAAYCDFSQLPLPALNLPVNLQLSKPVLRVAENLSDAALLRSALQTVYDVRADANKMRDTLLSCAHEQIVPQFDALRKHYPMRREVAAHVIENWSTLSVENKNLLRRLGFSDQ